MVGKDKFFCCANFQSSVSQQARWSKNVGLELKMLLFFFFNIQNPQQFNAFKT